MGLYSGIYILNKILKKEKNNEEKEKEKRSSLMYIFPNLCMFYNLFKIYIL